MGHIDSDTGIWSLEIAKRRHKTDLLLIAGIGSLYKPCPTADVGCGNGSYCKILKTYGWSEVHGFDGTIGLPGIGIYDDITYLDLTKRRYVGRIYDLVLCIEVGEHIPPEHEDTFINNLTQFVNKDLVLTWAVPGQYSASGHVNCQPNEYVIEKMRSCGLKYKKRQSAWLREHVRHDYFKNTVMVYGR